MTCESTIVVTTTRGIVVVPLCDVEWIEAADNYVRIWVGAQSYLLREALQRLEGTLRTEGFVRAHRRALVQIRCVTAVKSARHKALVAILSSGAKIPISRRRRVAFVNAVRARGISDRRSRRLLNNPENGSEA